MIQVEFLGPIEHSDMQVEASSLEQLSTILKQNPIIAPWLDKSAVAINDEMVFRVDTLLKDGDRVSILPPVCGG
ncbi:MAG: molybdenum cofactor biosynthesis protein MoaD [Sulfurovum sp. FS08-3]|nr:MAG: molybdenum cofactor biosynthesis protein MoaD [Sulfurovum sp. FS08-3]